MNQSSWFTATFYEYLWSLVSFFKKAGQPQPLLLIFSFFPLYSTENGQLVASWIQTQIIRVEGKSADHYTTSTAKAWSVCNCIYPFRSDCLPVTFSRDSKMTLDMVLLQRAIQSAQCSRQLLVYFECHTN